MASDDNSEFWLSPNESPAGAQLVAFVGKVSPPLPLRPHPFCLYGPPVAWVACPLQLLRKGLWVGLVPQGEGEPPALSCCPPDGLGVDSAWRVHQVQLPGVQTQTVSDWEQVCVCV